jgi:hypothetical protein
MQLPIGSWRRIQKPWTSIPRIDWSHPLARGLIGCYLPGVLRGHALVGPKLANGGDGPGSFGVTAEGASLRSATLGSAKGLVVTATSEFKDFTRGMSLFWRGTLRGNCDNYCTLIGIQYADTDVSPYYTFAVSADGTGYDILRDFHNEGSGTVVGNSADVRGSYGKTISVALTGKIGTGVQFYVNAAPIGGMSSLSGSPSSTGSSKIVINQGIDATHRSANADCNVGYFWNRDLTALEVKQLHDDPYCFLIYPEDEIFSTLVGGAGAPVDITGTINASEAPDTALISGTAVWDATLSASEASDTALISGTVFTQVSGTLSALEASDTALISGTLTDGISAAIAAQEAPDTALINGAVRWNATLAASEAPDTALINGTTAWNATLAATEAPDTALINGAVRWRAILAANEASDTALIQGTVTTAGEISGSLNALEASDTALINGAVTGIAGILTATEAPDTALINGVVRWNAALAASEAPDTALINGAVRWNAILAAIEASDIALIQGTVTAPATITGTLNAIEASDTALISGTLGLVPVTGTLNAIEAQDITLIVGNLVLPQVTGILAATEAPDAARINAYTELTGLPGVLTFGRTVVINRW